MCKTCNTRQLKSCTYSRRSNYDRTSHSVRPCVCLFSIMASTHFINMSSVADVTDSEWAWQRVTSSPVVMAAGGWLVFQPVQTTLTVLALSDNCLSLLIIYGLVRLTSPLRLLTSLSLADMLAAWAMMTSYLSAGNSAHHVTCSDVLHTSLLLSSHNAAALSLTSLATSHHIATFRPLHYDNLLSARRVWVVVATVWSLSCLLGHMQFVIAAVNHQAGTGSYCETVARHSYIAIIMSTLIAGLCLLAAVVIYVRILVYLRPVDAFLQQPAGLPDGRRRSRRGVVTGIMLFSCYALAWLPYLAVRLMYTSDTQHLVVSLSGTTLLVGCVLNPVIYGSRMTSLQDGYIRLWWRVVDRLRTLWSQCRHRRSDDDVSRLPTTPLNQLSSVCY